MESYKEMKKELANPSPYHFETTTFQCPKCRLNIMVPHLGELPPKLELTCPKCGAKILDAFAHIKTETEFNPSRR